MERNNLGGFSTIKYHIYWQSFQCWKLAQSNQPIHTTPESVNQTWLDILFISNSNKQLLMISSFCCTVKSGLNFIQPVMAGCMQFMVFGLQIVFLVFMLRSFLLLGWSTRFTDENVVKIKLYSTPLGNSVTANQQQHADESRDIFVDISQTLQHHGTQWICLKFVYACINI